MALLWVLTRYPNHRWLHALAFVTDVLLGTRWHVWTMLTLGAALGTVIDNRKKKPAMPSLKAIRAANAGTQREVTAKYGEAEVQVVFDPGKATGEVVQTIQDEQTAQALAAGLAQIIVSWDLTDEDAEPITPAKGKTPAVYPAYGHDAASLLKLPIAFLSAVMTAIGEDLQPTGEAAGSFSGG